MNSLNGEKLILKYNFKNADAGDADGVISMDFNGENCELAEKITVSWTKNGAALEGFTPICTLSGKELEAGYEIDKEMLIPYGVDGICAKFMCDGSELFISIPLPEYKKTGPYGEKKLTAALTSDYHFGGWGSKLAPKEGIAKGIEDMNAHADVVFANGDLVQWHAAYSEEEFQKYNWDGKKYHDNGETSLEFLHIGYSQWQVLEDAFKTFKIPVYATSGGHDIPDTHGWSKICCTDKYWTDFLKNWIKYSEDNGLYPEKIVRDESVSYYDTYVGGYHFIMTQMPRSVEPFNEFGDQQRKWLDKKLFENEESGKPVFVFGHNPVNWNLAGRHGLEETADCNQFVELLEKHPTAVYVSGHSHHTLDARRRNTIDGKQETPSYVHDGGMTSVTFPPTYAQVNGTHFVLADFYDDKVVIRARDSLNGKWISKGLTKLTLKEKCLVGSIVTLKEECDEGFMLTASCEPCVKVIWYLDGEAHEGKSIKVDRGFEGFVAVRVYDNEGNFKSVFFDSVNDI